MNEKKKIEVMKLYLIFGRERNKAFKMLMKGKSKQEIKKETGCTVAVNGANFTINEGEIFVIMGLSGSGKSSLLRCINRLNKPTFGAIAVDGKNIVTMSDEELRAVRRKELAMVFQHFGLLPHRTVLQNIAFGLELQGIGKERCEQKALECMKLVGLDGYENQMINELSGGMQQRVGLARALANDPEVLLMDEAFSALDPLIRVQMQDELLALQSKMKKTIVFITHDLEEAIKLGDRIAIMRDGEIQQIGTSEEILTEPANGYVQSFVENVDRSRIVTAASIMVDKPLVARLGKEGPEVLIRKMKERKLTVLPVVDAGGILQGEVRLGDLVKLREIQQIGTSEEILTEPANGYVQSFVENVDRSRIVTAASIMVDKPLVARLGKEGPEVLIRKMKERKLTVLPVVDAGGILQGEVRLGDLVKLREAKVKDIASVIKSEVHSITADTVVEDILPLMTKTNSPIWVVNEEREFEGVVPLSSLIVEVTGKDKEEINDIIQQAIDL